MEKEVKQEYWVADKKFLNSVILQKYDFNGGLEYLNDKVTEIIHRDSNFSSKKLVEQINRLFDTRDNQYSNDVGIFKEEQIVYGKDNYSAYLAYYLFANVYKIWQPLTDLALNGLLKRSINILDLGCGPGSEAIGIIEFYKRRAYQCREQKMQINICLCDKEDPFLEYAAELIKTIELPSNLTINLKRINSDINDIKLLDKEMKFDLITLNNVLCLNENEGKNVTQVEGVMKNILPYLDNNGSLIVINPGDQNGANDLSYVSKVLVDKFGIKGYSSCNSVMENCNCKKLCWKIARVYLEAPDLWVNLWKNGLSKGQRSSVPFCYNVFRKDVKRKYDDFMRDNRYMSLKKTTEHVGEKVSVAAVIVGIIDNGSGDKNVTLKLGDETCANVEGEFIVQFDRSVLCGKAYSLNFMANELIFIDDFLVEKDRNNYILKTAKDKIIFKLNF